MARHIQHDLARRAVALRPSSITTLSRFVDSLVADLETVSPALLDKLVRLALADLKIPAFQPVAGYEGFRNRLAGLIEEFSTTGTSASRLAEESEWMPFSTPEIRGFLRVYEHVERELTRRKLWLRGPRILMAAERVRDGAVRDIDEVLLDGFFDFSAPERRLLDELGLRTVVRIADAIELRNTRRPPRVVHAPSADQQAEIFDICRRIAAEAASGRPYRDMGVVMRTERPYAAMFRTALSRFGIPARFYFSANLEQQAPVRFIFDAVTAILSGWSYDDLLPLIRQDALNITPADRHSEEFELLRRRPASGLAATPRLGDWLAPLEGWRAASRTARQWVQALRSLLATLYPAPLDVRSQEDAHHWMERAEAMAAFERALDAAAKACNSDRLSLADFWPEVRNATRLTPFRVYDNRRNVVHVMDAVEARQWRLPVVFLCGLVEGEFPRHAQSDVIFPDAIRQSLAERGIGVRTSEDRERDEKLLFDLAAMRATELAVLTWPQATVLGTPLLESFALGGIPGETEPGKFCRPAPRGVARHPARQSRIEISLGSDKKWRPSEIERFFECPFRYFGETTLKLKTVPSPPEERFGPLERGSFVHDLLRQVTVGEPFDQAFERLLRERCRSHHVVATHRLEYDRLDLLRNLRAYFAQPVGTEGWKQHAEWPFEFPLIDGLVIRGRIDRFDVSSSGEVFAYDYKYSREDNVKKKQSSDRDVQGGLYLLALKAAGYRPHGFAYVPLRGEANLSPRLDVDALMDEARERALLAVDRITTGDIAVVPADRNNCRYCDFRDACRINEQAGAAAASGDGEG